MYPVNWAAMYSVIIILLLVHLTLLNYIRIGCYAPDLLLVAVIFLALFFGSGAGLEAGIVAGLGKDMLAFDYMGANTFTLAMTDLIIGALNSKFFKESKFTRTMIVFFFSALSMSIHLFIYNALSYSHDISFLSYAASPLLPDSLYTAVAALPLFRILENIFGIEESADIL